MRIWKNAFAMTLVAMFVLGVFAVPRSFAQGPTTVYAPTITDPSKGPGSTFSIDISLANVLRLVAFDFYLHYDTNVLTATGSLGYSPFTYPLPTQIDDSTGYIHVGASFPPPEYRGQDIQEEPYPIIKVAFSVDGYGASRFAIDNPVFANTTGQEMPVTVVNGWFRNVAGAPIAWFMPIAPTVVGTPVTFTSDSVEPNDGSLTLNWAFGDGGTGTLETETHTYGDVGQYTVTLKATSATGEDTQVRTVEITEPPLAGAIAVDGKATQLILNFTKTGSHKQILKAWATNIDATRKTLVRVDLDVWSANYGHVGAILTKNQWIMPGEVKLFQGTFDMMDPKWMFVGGGVGMDEFTVIPTVYYADFFYNNDPNVPHWAQVTDPPDESYTFTVVEAIPDPSLVKSYNDTTGVITLDATGSTDADTKWGDYIAMYRWRISAKLGTTFYRIVQVFGPLKSVDLVAAMIYFFGEAWDTTFRIQLLTMDTFSVYDIAQVDVFLDLPGV